MTALETNDDPLKDIERQIKHTRYCDQPSLMSQLRWIRRRQSEGQPFEKKWEQLVLQVGKSLQRVTERREAIPAITFPENLPVVARRDEIATCIQDNAVVILAGETGSGKTTQIPKICLSLGLGVKGMIGHTQPRRIAARTVASRIAEELGTELGGCVGYQVRFTDHSNDNTHIKLMTDGILLAEVQQDPLLLKYDVIIIDEAHERSLNIDFLLGYLKSLLKKRHDLKVIVTSATIDVERFSKHFEDAPIIEVSGRTYPVEMVYRPWDELFDDVTDAIVATINDIVSSASRKAGDILVFLSGERAIRETSLAIKKAQIPHLSILPLYARLTLAEQAKVFQSGRGRRVVLATNVAETSITVPGIRYVIDPGTARLSRYSVRTKVQRLPIEAISQASANQRAGRCGRVSDGECFRLYSEDDFKGREAFTDPEIQRTNLAAVILQMLHLKIGDIREFPFVDRPDNKLINDGFKLLEELGAVQKAGTVTSVGHQLSRLPLDPKLARMVLSASKWGCLREVLIIVSALSLQDPRERPSDKQQASDEKHRRFWHEHSDFFSLLSLWDYVEEQRQALSQNQLRKLCQKEFLNFLRLREWRELHHQLRLAAQRLALKENTEPASYEAVHRALLTGLVSNVALKNTDAPQVKAGKEAKKDDGNRSRSSREYEGTRGRKFVIFPASSQHKKRPKWLMASEFIETSQLFAHGVAKVEPKWILDSAEHLLKYNYYEPHYDSRSGQVKAFVRKTLLGLTLVEKQSVSYGKIDPVVSREVFIRSALVEGRYRGGGQFFKHNTALVKDVLELEAKSRRRDILVDDQKLFEFYDEILPSRIVNLAGFETWRKTVEADNPKCLWLHREQLMLHEAGHITGEQFPSRLAFDGVELPVQYCFEPGRPDDGVSINVPVEWLHELKALHLDWLVPGLIRDKCIALVKGLPKAKRKQLVPVPQFVDRALARIQPYGQSLTAALAEVFGHIANIEIVDEDWSQNELDDFYRMNIRVVDEQGALIDQHRDLDVLRQRYRRQVQKSLKSVGSGIEQEKLTSWSFGDLAATVNLKKGSVNVKAYPALIDNGADVALRLLDKPAQAQFDSRFGMARLALIELHTSVKYLQKNLLKGKDIGLAVINAGDKKQVIDDLILAAVMDACGFDLSERDSKTLTESMFSAAVAQAKPAVTGIAQEYEQKLVDCLKTLVQIKKVMKSHRSALALTFTFADIHQQIDHLFFPGFLSRTPFLWFREFPRYLKSLTYRLEKAPADPHRDKLNLQSVQAHWERHQERIQKEGDAAFFQSADWQHYRWMIEELRVSFFSQSLKTKFPVSDKRLNQQWQNL